MTADGVIPRHEDRCVLCHGYGWITRQDHDTGTSYEIPCPQGCPSRD